jgi:SAM-dependent methyltransferase
MMLPHVNYDQIATEYDQRYTASNRQDRGKALLALTQQLKVQRALEAACGTGHWLALLQAHVPMVVGLDLSRGMLAHARRRNASLWLTRGTAVCLPFRNNSFDLVYCVDAIHHFEAARAYIAEAHRVLRPRGVLAIVGSDPHCHQKDAWYGYEFFHEVYEMDLMRYPAHSTLIHWMDTEGFTGIASQEVEYVNNTKMGRAVLADPSLKKNACSQLALLSEEAYQAGVQQITSALEEAEAHNETLCFRSVWTVHMIVGYKGKVSSHGTTQPRAAADS